MNLLLIGLRGSGKSTLAALLAQRTGRPLVDLDELTPAVLDAPSVRDVWTRYSEDAFRHAETVALSRVLTLDGQIVALGGGTPTAPLAAELIAHERASGRAKVVYLAASPATLRARLETASNEHRPSLTGASVIDEIEAVHARREPLYRELADRVVVIDGRSIDDVLAELASIVGAEQGRVINDD